MQRRKLLVGGARRWRPPPRAVGWRGRRTPPSPSSWPPSRPRARPGPSRWRTTRPRSRASRRGGCASSRSSAARSATRTRRWASAGAGPSPCGAAPPGRWPRRCPRSRCWSCPTCSSAPRRRTRCWTGRCARSCASAWRRAASCWCCGRRTGSASFGTKWGPVKLPSDLKGHKMRSQESLVHVETYRALGALPQPIAVTEVLPALQTGVVDGFDNTPIYTFAACWHLAIKHFTLSEHIYQPGAVLIAKKEFDKLPADLQKIAHRRAGRHHPQGAHGDARDGAAAGGELHQRQDPRPPSQRRRAGGVREGHPAGLGQIREGGARARSRCWRPSPSRWARASERRSGAAGGDRGRRW